MGAVTDRVQAIIDEGGTGAKKYLESLDGLRLVMGEARFEEPGVVRVGDERLTAPRVLVATGAAPVAPPIPGLSDTRYLTSTDVLALRALPERLLVIGAGTRPDGGLRVTVCRDGAARDLDGDAILLGAGRGPDVELLALASAGIDGDRHGIPVDPRLQTSQDGHFAAGDVLGPPYGPFTHTARRLGRDAAENALGIDPHDADPDVGPWAIFTDPEFATVGMTEEKAREAGHDVGVGTSEFSGGKARAWGQERGLAKAVVDRSAGTILGAQVPAYHAADLIHPVVVAMRAGDPDALLGAYHVHLTLGETVQGAVRTAFAS